MDGYRVFVSYSHEDAEQARAVRAHLEAIGATPMSDLGLRPGVPFDAEIQHQISSAHVFVPILTRSSRERPWVHQELGYAMGLCVPILPLALDELPQGMAERVQAIRVRPDLSDLGEKLKPEDLERLVKASQKAATSQMTCADRLHARTATLVEWAERAADLDRPLPVRQRSAWGSFSIPRVQPDHPLFDARDGRSPRPIEVREKLIEERKIMETYAREYGCDLILDPYVTHDCEQTGAETLRFKHTAEGTAVRVRTLIEFLSAMPDDKVRVVFQRGRIEGSLMIVGDVFFAEAIVPHYGSSYRQTIFTRHAPTVLRRVRWFDDLFADLIAERDLEEASSRGTAIETLESLLGECETRA